MPKREWSEEEEHEAQAIVAEGELRRALGRSSGRKLGHMRKADQIIWVRLEKTYMK